VYELQGDRTKALAFYEEAAVLAPKDEMAWLNLAVLSAKQGSTTRAVEAFEKLKQLNPLRAKAVEPYIFKKQ
ncbi:MAG: tetratricopeptide repeat protein, partial [Desulfuromonadaceae bacterium]